MLQGLTHRRPDRAALSGRAGIVAAAAAGILLASASAWSADAAPAASVTSRVPADRASYFPAGSLQDIWKDLASRNAINQRIVEGGNHSVNVRTVRPIDAPLVHGSSVDVWIVVAGRATAVTGGELVDPQKRANTDEIAGSAIRNGTEQPLKPGDVVYVPQGVAHGFKDLQEFRALLLRVDTANNSPRP